MEEEIREPNPLENENISKLSILFNDVFDEITRRSLSNSASNERKVAISIFFAKSKSFGT